MTHPMPERARRRTRGIIAAVTAFALLAVGFGMSVAIGDALGISAQPAQRMGGVSAAVTEVSAPVAAPAIRLGDVPAGPRIEAAVDDLTDASGGVTGAGELPLGITAGDGPEDDDSYVLIDEGAGLRIDAASESGAARGLYDLADAVRQGRDLRDGVGAHDRSRLGVRMTDLGAVGVVADPDEWRDGTDYSHASKAFADVLLAEAPYIDQPALAVAYEDFDDYLRRVVADGYNAIAFPGLVEFLTFEATDGVYADGDEHIAKALALREAFTPFWDRAEELGVQIFLRTDMLTLTEPLEAYLTERFGGLDTEDPDLWSVYTQGLDELYAAAPALDGVLIRIGEAGRVYDVEGWDYYSSLAVTTPEAVREMLTAFTGQAEGAGREVIFRTWSVGVGAVGDMHTNAESYQAVLAGIDSPALIVSTKYTLGDFYSWLPLNDTLMQGEQRRIVEFQSRREFENNGAFPNDLGAEYAWALQTLLAGNDRIEGIWSWAQDGGPWRAGPMILYGKAGFWQLADLNSRLAVQLAMEPDADPAVITENWIREWFSSDPATVTAIAQAMALSREAIEQGLYIAPYAQQRVAAIGLEPPPMMWIFEWDILTGDSAALDVIYAISKDRIDEAIAGGASAVETVSTMRMLVEGTDAATWRDPAMREMLLGSLSYEEDVLALLADYRAMVLSQAQWHDTLSAESYSAWQDARSAYNGSSAGHLRTYLGDVDHPAFNLAAARLGVERADRDLAMSWAARALLLVAVGWVLIGLLRASRDRRLRALAPAASATWTAATRPWRAADAARGLGRLDRALVVIVPGVLLVATRLVQTSFLSWTHPALTLGAWAVFVTVAVLLLRRISPWPFLLAVAGVIVLRCVLALAALSLSGPGGYWFAFWTDPARRTIYISVAVALFIWLFVAAGWALGASWSRRRATGVVLAAVGLALAIPAAVVALIGLETALTLWNDELGLLPWGLARILGITVYLDIPAETAAVACVAGLGIALLGVLLALPWSRPPRSRSARRQPVSGVGAAA